MRLVICHKHNESFVNLFYPSADAARAARNRAFREAADKHSKIATFGPDMLGQDTLIHLECIGSVSVIEGNPVKEEKPQVAPTKGNGSPDAKPEAPTITPIRQEDAP